MSRTPHRETDVAGALPAEPDETGVQQADEARRVATAIGRGVMAALGKPADFYRVSVIRLWADTYRVNVLTGLDPSALTIAHSYFVTADDQGNVVRTTPPLARRY
jgi:hypothetical protein